MGNTLDDQSIDRIGRSVRFTEGWRRERPAAGMTGMRVRADDEGGVTGEWDAEVDGGEEGDANTDTRCSFTYTLMDPITGEIVGTKVPMTGPGQRLFPIKMHAGTVARGHFDADGKPVMTWCNETMDAIMCEVLP